MIKLDKKERIKELVKQLNKYSYEYYTLDNPTITDKEYDKLYDELKNLEEETGYILKDTPTQRIGDVVLKDFKKVNHNKKLWSLDKKQSKDELKLWLRSVSKFCKDNNLPIPKYIITKKYDGLTLKIDYDNFEYKLGSSRGNGDIGEDLTQQCNTIINLPKKINSNIKFSFRGEGLMSKRAFEEYNKMSKIPLKNLRNGVAGALRNLDTKETAKRKPFIKFYEINDYDENVINFSTYEEQLIFMKNMGLTVAEYKICETPNEIIEEIDNIQKERPNLQYDIDGVVIAINDLKTREKMGYTIKFPKWAMAYKYEAEETTTLLKDVIWNVGRTRRITPVGILEPVEFNGGVTVTKATLNNLDDIDKKDIKINSVVNIRRSNDVIPEITGIAEVTGNEIDIVPPPVCPNCGNPTEIIINKKSGKRTLMCTNENCALIQQLDHYGSRDAMNIVGLSKETIRKFVDLGYLTCIEDIYKLEQHRDEITKLKGFGSKSFDKLINNIEKSKNITLDKFIYALGIPNVGKVTAKDMVEFADKKVQVGINNLSVCLKIPEIIDKMWLNMKNCGEVLSKSIYEYFLDKNNLKQYINLLNILNVQTEEKNIVNDIKDNPLKDKRVYPTGKFKLTKSELKIKLNELGAIMENGYKKSLDYLIVGDKAGQSKIDKAIKDGVNIMTKEEFENILK